MTAGVIHRVLELRWPTLLAVSLVTGIAGANVMRAPAAWLLLVAACCCFGAMLARTAAPRFALLAAGLLVAGLWWGGARLDALAQSPLSGQLGRSAIAEVVVTGPARRTPFAVRAPGQVRRWDGVLLRERVLLQLRGERAPPQGAVLRLRARAVEPRRPETGFDERGWLARQGIRGRSAGRGLAHRRPAGRDRWRRRPVARGGRGGSRLRHERRAASAPDRGRARRGRGNRPVAQAGVPRPRARAHPGRVRPERGDPRDRHRGTRLSSGFEQGLGSRLGHRCGARLCAGGRLAAIGRARSGCWLPRVSRMVGRAAPRSMALPRGRRGRSARVVARSGATTPAHSSRSPPLPASSLSPRESRRGSTDTRFRGSSGREHRLR